MAKIVFVTVFIWAALTGGLARAQMINDSPQSGPATMQLGSTVQSSEVLSTRLETPGVEALQGYSNPWFRDILVLNHQNEILSALIARQSSISKVGANYAKMGLAYESAPPDRQMCRQIPLNAPCARAYPDLYGRYAEMRQAEIEAERAKLVALVEEEMKRQRALSTTAAVGEEILPSFQWKDVRCVQSNCTAQLVEDNVLSRVRTVRVGEKIHKDIRVADISHAGVVLSVKGKAVSITPAPLNADGAEGGMAASVPSAPIQDLLAQAQPAANTDQQQPAAGANTPAAPAVTAEASGADSASQPLGETGLF